MSISTLLNKNNFKIYVNELNLKNLNLSSDGNYKIKNVDFSTCIS